MAQTKVFCIGFHKTGTSSLAQALRRLAYRVCFNLQWNNPDLIRDVERVCFDLTKKYDAFEDNPWPLLYQQLDEWYPEAKFILTRRDTESWYRSASNFFGDRSTLMRQWIYGENAGSPIGNKAIYCERYDRHYRDVLAHFADQPDRMTIMDITKGDSWPELCRFLGKNVPDAPFPHAKRAEYQGDGDAKAGRND
ncbi:MAG: sulfotransferase [Rhodospirillaceae bacterium]|nr:sulfotransferase [Rhodospirillaceae bacterium]